MAIIESADPSSVTAPDEERLEENQELIDEAKKIAHDLREHTPDPDPPDEGTPQT